MIENSGTPRDTFFRNYEPNRVSETNLRYL